MTVAILIGGWALGSLLLGLALGGLLRALTRRQRGEEDPVTWLETCTVRESFDERSTSCRNPGKSNQIEEEKYEAYFELCDVVYRFRRPGARHGAQRSTRGEPVLFQRHPER